MIRFQQSIGMEMDQVENLLIISLFLIGVVRKCKIWQEVKCCNQCLDYMKVHDLMYCWYIFTWGCFRSTIGEVNFRYCGMFLDQ